MMKLFRLIFLVLLCAITVSAEMRMWTADDGTRFWGEFARLLLGRVQIRDVNGELRLLTIDKLSEQDLSYMEATIPPKVEIDVKSKTTNLDVLRNDTNYTTETGVDYTVTLTRKSKLNSTVPVTVELYLVANDLTEHFEGWVLRDRKVDKFVFPKGKTSEHVFKVDKLVYREYESWGPGIPRGLRYLGYVVAVLGPKGELLAHKTDLHEKWMKDLGVEESINRLRALYIENKMNYFVRYFNEDIKKIPVPQMRYHYRTSDL